MLFNAFPKCIEQARLFPRNWQQGKQVAKKKWKICFGKRIHGEQQRFSFQKKVEVNKLNMSVVLEKLN